MAREPSPLRQAARAARRRTKAARAYRCATSRLRAAVAERTTRRSRALVSKKRSNPGNDGHGQPALAARRNSAHRSANPSTARGRWRNRPRREQKTAPTARSKRTSLSSPGCGANYFSFLRDWAARLCRSSAWPRTARSQRCRESVTGANTHPGCELQKQNNHRLLKNKEFLSASLAEPFLPSRKSGPNLANLLCGMRRKGLAARVGSEASWWPASRR